MSRLSSGITAGIVSGMTDDAPPSTYREDKVRENRLRRMAKRQNRTVTRLRRRDPFGADYGVYLVDGERVGDLDAVERALTGGRS